MREGGDERGRGRGREGMREGRDEGGKGVTNLSITIISSPERIATAQLQEALTALEHF